MYGLPKQVSISSSFRSIYKTYSTLNTAINRMDKINFYRAMHFSAKRGIAIACRLSVCL